MYYKRKALKRIMDYIDDKECLVLQGARQVGKTTLMKLIIKELEEKGIEKEI
jgi:predicted AAA+ superfamily ATPase